MRKIDFFIVGQPKSGTTALSHFLNQHPDIGIADHKEPNYFSTDILRESDEFYGQQNFFYIRTAEQYEEIFENVKHKKLLGEATTNYLYSKEAAQNIYNFNPNAKIIISLRNPVDFMYSLHMQYVNEGKENETDFIEALNKEEKRKRGGDIPKWVGAPSLLYYRDRANYYPQVKRYLDTFPRNNVLIIIFEKFKNNNEKYYEKVLSFLGADQDFKPEFKTVHGSKAPINTKLNYLLNNQRLKKNIRKIFGRRLYEKIRGIVTNITMKSKQREPLGEEVRAKILDEIQPNIKKLDNLIDHDLQSIWHK